MTPFVLSKSSIVKLNDNVLEKTISSQLIGHLEKGNVIDNNLPKI